MLLLLVFFFNVFFFSFSCIVSSRLVWQRVFPAWMVLVVVTTRPTHAHETIRKRENDTASTELGRLPSRSHLRPIQHSASLSCWYRCADEISSFVRTVRVLLCECKTFFVVISSYCYISSPVSLCYSVLCAAAPRCYLLECAFSLGCFYISVFVVVMVLGKMHAVCVRESVRSAPAMSSKHSQKCARWLYGC